MAGGGGGVAEFVKCWAEVTAAADLWISHLVMELIQCMAVVRVATAELWTAHPPLQQQRGPLAPQYTADVGHTAWTPPRAEVCQQSVALVAYHNISQATMAAGTDYGKCSIWYEKVHFQAAPFAALHSWPWLEHKQAHVYGGSHTQVNPIK